jgi:hypothetical protein
MRRAKEDIQKAKKRLETATTERSEALERQRELRIALAEVEAEEERDKILVEEMIRSVEVTPAPF